MKLIFEIPNADKEKQALLNLLVEEDNMVLAQAYLYAKNLIKQGIDIAEKWSTVTQQSEAVYKAYNNGYYDAMTHKKERIVPWVEDYTQWDPYHHSFNGFKCTKCGNIQRWQTKYCPQNADKRN